MNTNLNTKNPLPTIELPREIIMKIQTDNEITIQDIYEVKTTFTPKFSCFRERELLGNDAIKVLTPEFKFTIYGHIDSIIRSGAWHHSEIACQLSEFLEAKKFERLDNIDKSKII